MFQPIINWNGAAFYEAPYERADPKSILANLRWVRKIANKNGINHMTGGPHYFLLAIPFRHNVLTIHDLVLLHNSRGLKHWIFKWLWFKLPIMFSNAVTCITDTVRNDLLEQIGADKRKIFTIYNPVSPIYQYTEHTFNKDCPRILHIGTAWNKNTERVASALKGIKCKLVIVGKLTPDIYRSLKEAQVDYELFQNITNEELYQQYQKADIISFPSLFEGFGMPIIEGQATGRAILTSNIPPMTEVAGEGACHVIPTDINSIRDGFLRIITDDSYRNSLIRNGLENVKRFSVKNISEQYNKIYDIL